ncbi:hypothetical protein QCA50_011108 [Cerrena zonata]|uniref:Uncharacterized protein n=1 Tax=Cerrena zonata TaxID=2478898 RepID=A0AAW0G071_9APHY
MRDEILVNRRQVHRRVVPGLKRLQARFSPTAVFDSGSTAATVTLQNPVDTVAATTTPDPTTAAVTTPVVATTQVVPVTPATSATPTPATTDTNTTPVLANTQTSPSSSSTSSSSSSTSSVAVNTPVVSNTPTTTTSTATNANTNTRATAATQPSAAASRTVTQTLGAVSASPSSSSVAVASGSTINTGALIAGIVGGIVGVAIIVYVITWYMRRARQKEKTMPRTSMQVPSDANLLFCQMEETCPSRSMTMNRGFNDTPASHQMFQPTADYAPVSYPTSPMSSQPGQHGSYGYDQPSFAPGQYMDMAQNPMSPNTPFSVNPTSAHPFFAPIGHSPSNSPTVAHYESAYNAQGQLVERKNSVGASQYLTRQSSMNQQYAGDEHLASDADYVDLSRASVTPFQAQQYEEISRRLNTAPPVPALPTPTLPMMPDQELAAGRAPANTRPLSLGQNITTIPPHLNIYQDNAMPESPFADPSCQIARHARQSARRCRRGRYLLSERSLPSTTFPGILFQFACHVHATGFT